MSINQSLRRASAGDLNAITPHPWGVERKIEPSPTEQMEAGVWNLGELLSQWTLMGIQVFLSNSLAGRNPHRFPHQVWFLIVIDPNTHN